MQAGAEPDAALIDASRRGDRAAFGQLVERYQRAVHAVVFSHVRDRALSDDLTQEAFIAAWRGLAELRDVARLPAWLCSIARNLARDACRRRRREASGEVPEVETAPTPFQAINDAESERLIAAALERVPDVYREPLVLYYYEQQSIDDVARYLGITATTANKRLSRGRRYLADHVNAIVECGRARRGPRPDVIAGVLTAIGLLGSASHVDASPPKGSTMFSKLSFATVLTTTAVAGIGLLAAGTPGDRARTSASRAAARSPAKTSALSPGNAPPGSSSAQPAATPVPIASAEPRLAVGQPVAVPSCATAAKHLAELWIAEFDAEPIPPAKHAALVAERAKSRERWCEAEAWSETRRLCIVDADDYERSNIDCTDEPAATTAEVAALPPNLRCDVLAQHAPALMDAPDTKFGILKAAMPDRTAEIDKRLLELRDQVKTECDERPWSVEHRRCVAAAETHAAFTECGAG
jgi:RNA polymerase sigma factor (sigma-70 family)